MILRKLNTVVLKGSSDLMYYFEKKVGLIFVSKRENEMMYQWPITVKWLRIEHAHDEYHHNHNDSRKESLPSENRCADDILYRPSKFYNCQIPAFQNYYSGVSYFWWLTINVSVQKPKLKFFSSDVLFKFWLSKLGLNLNWIFSPVTIKMLFIKMMFVSLCTSIGL